MRAVFAVLYIVLLGVAAHVVGEALPRRWFHFDRRPYRCRDWERGGAAYERLGVQRCKLRVPDASRYAPDMVKKRFSGKPTAATLERLLQETCVAECIHWVLLACSAGLWLLLRGVAGTVATALYALSHLPFIIIQRYNRPRLARLYLRLGGNRTVQQPAPCAEAAQPVGAA